ncbi:hypothetical protein R20233_03389 [Ralstonia sp. LMG 32965]|uniref:hypothetical protein n=1 Tax=Ralstonia flatus TaxID=3058601 RepID=UPI0028F59FF1|nr:hypothetical protein [Ralstonia sp. LMG 32965]CAJ0889260.1 hypothetical protein R20233_03389 [Ralstonia sp. LMG 32965]
MITFWRACVRRCGAVLAGLALSTAAVHGATMFEDFTTPDGAMTVFAQGDYVEPYVAIEALLVAHRLGVDVQAPAVGLANWLLPYQQANGTFPRICRSGIDGWRACGHADADDSQAVFWCLLVNEILHGPPQLLASCSLSLAHLATLWDPKRTTFQAFADRPEAYFADNVEVAGALKRLRADPKAALHYTLELAALPSHKQMMDGLAHAYGYQLNGALDPARVSLPPTPYGFYPTAVAPVYPWVHDLETGSAARRKWAVWMFRHGQTWLSGKADPFPWGLIAWAAYTLGDAPTAQKWLQAAPQWRAAGRWNLMEEGALIGLSHALAVSQ